MSHTRTANGHNCANAAAATLTRRSAFPSEVPSVDSRLARNAEPDNNAIYLIFTKSKNRGDFDVLKYNTRARNKYTASPFAIKRKCRRTSQLNKAAATADTSLCREGPPASREIEAMGGRGRGEIKTFCWDVIKFRKSRVLATPRENYSLYGAIRKYTIGHKHGGHNPIYITPTTRWWLMGRCK